MRIGIRAHEIFFETQAMGVDNFFTRIGVGFTILFGFMNPESIVWMFACLTHIQIPLERWFSISILFLKGWDLPDSRIKTNYVDMMVLGVMMEHTVAAFLEVLKALQLISKCRNFACEFLRGHE